MNAITQRSTAEAEVRELMESWLRAVHAVDVDGIVAHYSRDILAFDAIAKLQFKGREAYKAHWKACMELCNAGSMTFELHDLNVVAGDDVAFVTALSRCGGIDEKGEEKTGWMRLTTGCRRIDGKWTIVHEHFSAPFDMETMKVLELSPVKE